MRERFNGTPEAPIEGWQMGVGMSMLAATAGLAAKMSCSLGSAVSWMSFVTGLSLAADQYFTGGSMLKQAQRKAMTFFQPEAPKMQAVEKAAEVTLPVNMTP